MSKSDQKETETSVVSASSTSKQGGCKRCCRQTLTFLASTVGLTVLTAAYSALGGYIFMVLESPVSPAAALEDTSPTGPASEAVVVGVAAPGLSLDRGAVRESLKYHLERLWNATEHFNVIYKESWVELAEEVLKRYTDDVFEAVRVNGSAFAAPEGTNTLATAEGGGCAPEQVESSSNQWSYPGSLLYAITVVTTIGYGHITPKTQWGMIVTMVYAVFGIPLTFLTIAHLGRIMATAFRFVYRHVCCFVCRTASRARRRRQDGKTADDGVTREASPCVVVEKGESKPETEVAVAADEGGGGGEEKKAIADVKVPISVTVVVLVGYIGLGSLLFSFWEQWTMVEASYFCFITISTIGFGDFVPGMSLEGVAGGGAEGSHAKLLCCALYLLLGLSFLAMCFDLIQEEVVNKFRRMGKCIGLVKESK